MTGILEAGKHGLLPASWCGPRLVALGRILGVTGFETDTAWLRDTHAARLNETEISALSEQETRRARDAWCALQPAELTGKLDLLQRLACDLDIDLGSLFGPDLDTFDPDGTARAWLLVQWHAAQERPGAAVEVFEQAGSESPCDLATALAYIASLDRLGRDLAARRFITDYARQVGWEALPPAVALRYAILLCKDGSRDTARPILDALAGRCFGAAAHPVPDWVQARAMLYHRSLAGPEKTLAKVRQALEARPGSPLTIAHQVRLTWRVHGLEAARRVLVDALVAQPFSPTILSAAFQVPFSDTVYNEIADQQLSAFSSLEDVPQTHLPQLLDLALVCCRMDLARQIAQADKEQTVTSRLMLRGLLKPSPRLSGNWGEGPFQAAVTEGASSTVVVFPPIHRRLGMLPIRIVDSFFADRGINALYCNDESNFLFSAGLPGYGTRFADVMAHVAAMPMVAGARHLIVIGTSIGGFPAIRASLALGAEQCLAFSPKTSFLNHPGDRSDPIMERAIVAFQGLSPEDRDLASCWPETTETRVTAFYGADVGADVDAARRLQGCKGVSLVPLEAVDAHNTLLPCVESGVFDAALAPFARA